MLASESLLQVLSAQEVGLMLHHFNAAKLNTMRAAYNAAAAAAVARPPPLTPSTPPLLAAAGAPAGRGGGRAGLGQQASAAAAAAGDAAAGAPTNVASIVAHHALMRALQRHNAQLARRAPDAPPAQLTYEQLRVSG